MIVAVSVCGALSVSARAQTSTSGVEDAPAGRVVTNGSVAAAGASQTLPVPAIASASAKWKEIKDFTYDRRDLFFAGLDQLEATVDAEIKELKTRRAAMKSTVDTRDWDFAMKEMVDSRSYLRSVSDELRKTEAGTWDQQKEKVAGAWTRAQNAYDAVKKSTTS